MVPTQNEWLDLKELVHELYEKLMDPEQGAFVRMVQIEKDHKRLAKLAWAITIAAATSFGAALFNFLSVVAKASHGQ